MSMDDLVTLTRRDYIMLAQRYAEFKHALSLACRRAYHLEGDLASLPLSQRAQLKRRIRRLLEKQISVGIEIHFNKRLEEIMASLDLDDDDEGVSDG